MEAALDPLTEALRCRFRDDTPFFAGGVVRRPDGGWHYPGAGEFQGCVKIINKSRLSVPCIAKPWQLECDEIMERQRAAGLPVRLIILKARKLGFSTWIAVKFLQKLVMVPYQYAIITAQDTKTAGTIFNMQKHAYAHLPTEHELGLGFNVKPTLIGGAFTPNGRKFMEWGEESRRLQLAGRTESSLLEIDTANSPEAGRGGTPNLLHLSEVARWAGEQATQKMLSQLNAVAYEPGTIVVLESTANGLNHYYRRWNNAVAGESDPDRTGETYAPLFVPWWRDPAATIRFLTESAREAFVESIGDTRQYGEVAEDEEAIAELYDLTAEQLAWRRMMIRTQHENNVQLFKQENPSSPEEAFIGSGRTVFGGVLIARAIKEAQAAPAPERGTVRIAATETRRTRGGTIEVPSKVVWVPEDAKAAEAAGVAPMAHDEHLLLVWEQPRPEPEPGTLPVLPPVPTRASASALLEHAAALARAEGAKTVKQLGKGRYVVACDVAEGEVNTLTEGDRTVVQVFDHESGVQVATHASRMDQHDLPRWLYAVALFFNEALLAVEWNGPGSAINDALHKDYRYRNMYRRKKIDQLRRVEEKKPGWQTTKVTKPALEQTMMEALAEDTAGIRDIETAREFTTYVVTDRGYHEAQHGEHDDRLMAFMIGKRVLVTERPRKGGSGRRGRRGDDVTGYGAGYG